MQYNRELKKQLCENVCIHGFSTLKTAEEYNIPIKTLFHTSFIKIISHFLKFF